MRKFIRSTSVIVVMPVPKEWDDKDGNVRVPVLIPAFPGVTFDVGRVAADRSWFYGQMSIYASGDTVG